MNKLTNEIFESLRDVGDYVTLNEFTKVLDANPYRLGEVVYELRDKGFVEILPEAGLGGLLKFKVKDIFLMCLEKKK